MDTLDIGLLIHRYRIDDKCSICNFSIFFPTFWC